MKKIAFAGTDGRTLLWAYVVSTATSDHFENDFEGLVVIKVLEPSTGIFPNSKWLH